jgi:eukaryotic-like serine/threonine-protein kinase
MDTDVLSIRPEMLTPGTLVDHWRILESLGTRGPGALYRAEDVRHPGEPRVLRLSLRAGEGLFEDRVPRLMATHPNMARMHAHGRWVWPGGGFFYSVRDDVPGLPLAEWVEQTNPTFLQIAALLGRLASAVDDMHVRDSWHRELHPDNIQVRQRDGEPVLLDLRAGGNEALKTLLETPLPAELQVFRSPEALRFLRVNHGRPHACYRYLPTGDLYSLGAIAYWLVTGHPPFPLDLPPEQLHVEIELRPPVAPWEVNPRVPKPLGAIILRLMSKLPEARSQTGESLSAELMVAVSAGARAIWSKRVFEWEYEPVGPGAIPGRVRRPEAPKVPSRPGPRLPRVLHFNPPSEQRIVGMEPARGGPRALTGEQGESLEPWQRMM